MDAFQLVASRNREKTKISSQPPSNWVQPSHSDIMQHLSNEKIASQTAGSVRSSGSSNSSSRRAKENRITRLVSTMVHLLFLNVPIPESPRCWMRFAEGLNARPSDELYAFSHRILTSHKWELPLIMITLKYLERYHKCRKLKEKLHAESLIDEAFGSTPMEVDDAKKSYTTEPISQYELITVSFMLANKFLDDNRFSNRWWAKVSDIPNHLLNVLELRFLGEIEFNLFVGDVEYVEWTQAMKIFAKWLGQLEERLNSSMGSIHSNRTNFKTQFTTIPFHASSPNFGISPSPSITSISSAATCFSDSTPFDRPKYAETHNTQPPPAFGTDNWAVFSNNQ